MKDKRNNFIKFNDLINLLNVKNPYYKLNIKTNQTNLIKYAVINFNINKNYHVTIFSDQWNNYYKETGLNYYLFHVSTNETVNRCSTYYWIDINTLKIKEIPEKYFHYNQTFFDLYNSTRSSCKYNDIIEILDMFQKLLNIINEKILNKLKDK